MSDNFKLPERMPGRMSDRMSKYMSDRMPENVSVSEYMLHRWSVGGDHSKKVVFFSKTTLVHCFLLNMDC